METRDEFEYSIPVKDAVSMINMSEGNNIIVKVRSHNDATNWDIDRYVDDNSGLIVAEKEYPSEEELRKDEIPDWCIRNLTYEDRFYNRNLATDSFKTFPEVEHLLKTIHGSLDEAKIYSHNMESYIFELDGIFQKYKD
jgi:CYTH domain-containing protein